MGNFLQKKGHVRESLEILEKIDRILDLIKDKKNVLLGEISCVKMEISLIMHSRIEIVKEMWEKFFRKNYVKIDYLGILLRIEIKKLILRGIFELEIKETSAFLEFMNMIYGEESDEAAQVYQIDG